jgi:hypothetical protein
MDRKSKQEQIKEYAEAYQRGLIALANSLKQFKELTGVDLTGDIDVSGRHMGQAPYVKLTAERLTEVAHLIEGEIAEPSATVTEISIAERGRTSCFPRIEAPSARLVFEPYRPVRS